MRRGRAFLSELFLWVLYQRNTAANPTDGNTFHLPRYVRSVARGQKTGSGFIYSFVYVYVFMRLKSKKADFFGASEKLVDTPRTTVLA